MRTLKGLSRGANSWEILAERLHHREARFLADPVHAVVRRSVSCHCIEAGLKSPSRAAWQSPTLLS